MSRGLNENGAHTVDPNEKAIRELAQLHKVHEQDFILFRHLDGLDGLFLDIGANAGQSALSFFCVNNTMKVLSLEPNRELEHALSYVETLYPTRFKFRLIGASNVNGEANLMIPKALHANLTVYGSLVPAEFDKLYVQENLRREIATKGTDLNYCFCYSNVYLVTIDSLELNPYVIKMDVEGFERWVILGAKDTITRHHPVLMIEVNTDSPFIFSLLHTMGYACYYYSSPDDRLYPWPSTSRVLNAIWIHPDTPEFVRRHLSPLLAF